MEEGKNQNQSPVQSLSPEQTPTAVPPVPETPKPKFKLPILLVVALVFLILISTASAVIIFSPKSSSNQQEQKEVVVTPQSLNGRKLLYVNFPLISGHRLYMEYDASIVPMGKLFDLEVSSRNIIQIKGVDELSRIIGQISTKEQALAFVKFFTSYPTRFLLKPNPFHGIEPSDTVSERPYRQMSDSLTRLMTTTNIELRNGQWVIERDLLMYPKYPNRADQKKQTPAQLVRSFETISKTGTYIFSVGKVLAEGDEIRKFLPYYR